tara:strand:+ start:13909 stop:14067 length:159 start_codon:yes stop_codon:yes gene_type:complete
MKSIFKLLSLAVFFAFASCSALEQFTPAQIQDAADRVKGILPHLQPPIEPEK